MKFHPLKENKDILERQDWCILQEDQEKCPRTVKRKESCYHRNRITNLTEENHQQQPHHHHHVMVTSTNGIMKVTSSPPLPPPPSPTSLPPLHHHHSGTAQISLGKISRNFSITIITIMTITTTTITISASIDCLPLSTAITVYTEDPILSL